MKPLDVLTALDAAGDKATQGEWRGSMTGHSIKADRDYDEVLFAVPCNGRLVGDRWDEWLSNVDFAVAAANARPALKQHLAAVARLVEAARRVLNGGDCTCDPAVSGSRTDFCGACELRAALKEVTS